MNHKAKYLVLLLCYMSVVSFKPQKLSPLESSITLYFANYVNKQPVLLSSVKYVNALNQDFTISTLKYYIGNIELEQQDGTILCDSDFFLIDQEMESSMKIKLLIPRGNYKSINFILGVDSIHNCSGVQTDELDPMYGMFWAWKTGYIFFKLDGTSSFSSQPKHMIEYHIGGYQTPYNCIRKIHIPLNTNGLELNKGIASIKLKTDISELFTHPMDVDFTKLSSVNDIHYSTVIADNYTDMFSVMEIK